MILKLDEFVRFKSGSQKSPRSRRQRTTSLNQSSQKPAAESIIRTHHRTIYTAGRPPWYNTVGEKVEPFVIGKLSIFLNAYFQQVLKKNYRNVFINFIVVTGWASIKSLDFVE